MNLTLAFPAAGSERSSSNRTRVGAVFSPAKNKEVTEDWGKRLQQWEQTPKPPQQVKPNNPNQIEKKDQRIERRDKNDPTKQTQKPPHPPMPPLPRIPSLPTDFFLDFPPKFTLSPSQQQRQPPPPPIPPLPSKPPPITKNDITQAINEFNNVQIENRKERAKEVQKNIKEIPKILSTQNNESKQTSRTSTPNKQDSGPSTPNKPGQTSPGTGSSNLISKAVAKIQSGPTSPQTKQKSGSTTPNKSGSTTPKGKKKK